MSDTAKLNTGSEQVAWRLSLVRVMLGVAIAAMFLTMDSMIVLTILAYILYPIAVVWLTATKRLASIAQERPASYRLVWIAFASLLVGWPILGLGLYKSHFWMSFPSIIWNTTRFLVATPVVLVSLAVWLLIPLPWLERRRP